jgi:L,D-transpeptidase YbiS
MSAISTSTSSFYRKNEDPLSKRVLTSEDAENFEKCRKLCKTVHATTKSYLILINCNTQKLHVFEKRKLLHSYAISTGKNGEGEENGSGKTPRGLHHIENKIGENADPYDIFKARVNTKEKANLQSTNECITGRILWLSGKESGHNKGKNGQGVNVDSHDRYIYIHGTNRVEKLGQKDSGGCIRMKPEEVVELYIKVSEKTPVYIYP